MKKQLKRIMAIMLSLVMVLGCIPSFINEVGAVDLPSSSSIKDLLPIIAPGFPSTLEDAWVNSNGYKVYYSDGKLKFNGHAIAFLEYSGTNCIGNLDGTSYKFDGGMLVFNMENGILTSISSSDGSYGGTYKVVLKPISEVNIISSGVLARNFQTKKYEVANDAPYTITDGGKWYKEDLSTESTFSNDETNVYRKLTLTPKSGYEFTESVDYQYNGDFYSGGRTTRKADGTLLIVKSDVIIANTVYLDFPEPTTYSDLIALDTDYKDDKSEFTMKGAEEFQFSIAPISDAPFNVDEKGVFVLCFNFKFNNEDERNSIENVYFNHIDGEALSQTHMASDITDFYNKVKTDGLAYIEDPTNVDSILLCYKVDLHKTVTITMPTAVGTTAGDIIENAAISTTASTDTAEFELDEAEKRKFHIFELIGGTDGRLLEDTDVLENNKEYFIEFQIYDIEAPAYSSIKVNDTTLTYFLSEDLEQCNNHYYTLDPIVEAYYKIDLRQPSGGSKKYKANDKEDTTEKITGTGKKGSKRTIIPEPNRKVESVIVTDKDGNTYEVTNEGDGTYSFIQPATNVDVKVKYKNRLIKLTIGSLDASVDDVHHNLDVVPKVVNDRTMLPIRFVAENLGAKVDWDEKHPDTVIITRGDTKIEITLGSDKAKVNGEEYILDSVAFAENDRTYLPVRFVSEKLNAIVEWDESRPMDVIIYER